MSSNGPSVLYANIYTSTCIWVRKVSFCSRNCQAYFLCICITHYSVIFSIQIELCTNGNHRRFVLRISLFFSFIVQIKAYYKFKATNPHVFDGLIPSGEAHVFEKSILVVMPNRDPLKRRMLIMRISTRRVFISPNYAVENLSTAWWVIMNLSIF